MNSLEELDPPGLSRTGPEEDSDVEPEYYTEQEEESSSEEEDSPPPEDEEESSSEEEEEEEYNHRIPLSRSGRRNLNGMYASDIFDRRPRRITLRDLIYGNDSRRRRPQPTSPLIDEMYDL